MKTRHDELAQEMIKREYNHNSSYEMPDISYLSEEERNFKVNKNVSVYDLCFRCEECKKRINEWRNNFNEIIPL
jgi:hypothetical protein